MHRNREPIRKWQGRDKVSHGKTYDTTSAMYQDWGASEQRLDCNCYLIKVRSVARLRFFVLLNTGKFPLDPTNILEFINR